MSIEKILRISEIQRFCMHDGPGVRTTVFLKGCPLRCEWCHNPETQKKRSELLFYKAKCIECGACASVCPSSVHSFEGGHTLNREKCARCFRCAEVCPAFALDVSGKDMSVSEILEAVMRDRAFYGELGGLTLSGGEPFGGGDAVIDLLSETRAKGMSTAVETCGYADPELLAASVPFVDLYLYDVKDTDSKRHKRYTGVSNEKIIDNLFLLDSLGARIRLRCILVNRVNTDKSHYMKVAEIAGRLHNLEGVELIPYHAYGGGKATFIGLCDNGREEWIPTEKQINEAREIIGSFGISLL